MTIMLKSSKIVYEGWLTLHVASLAADGGPEFRREIEDHGRAVAVLPYDADRRVALLVELPRAPVLFVGELDLFLEAPAGLLEDGEPPEAGARREAHADRCEASAQHPCSFCVHVQNSRDKWFR